MRACIGAELRRRQCIDAVKKRRREELLSVTSSVVKQNAKVFRYPFFLTVTILFQKSAFFSKKDTFIRRTARVFTKNTIDDAMAFYW